MHRHAYVRNYMLVFPVGQACIYVCKVYFNPELYKMLVPKPRTCMCAQALP